MLLSTTPRRSSWPDPLTGRAAALCRAVARADLAGLPVYVVRKSAVPAGLGGDAQCGGFTNELLDVVLQDVIGPSWRGRGPCMVIDDALSLRTFLSVAAHEVVHILERDQLVHPVPAALTTADVREVVTPTLAKMAGPSSEWNTSHLACDHHGPAFFRLGVHVLHRAAECGYRLHADIVLGGWPAQSPAEAYMAALGDEPERMARSTFRDIRATPVPAALERLWQRDAAAAVAG